MDAAKRPIATDRLTPHVGALPIRIIAPSSARRYRCTKRRTSGGTRMASTEEAVEAEHAPGAGQAPPVDALHADVGVRRTHEIPIIVRGEGCYVYDEHGKRYLDGLSALFCVNIGHGRADIAQAGADQAKELGFFTNWSYAHPPAIELAARIASLAPGDLNRVFFTSGGSEAVESALQARPPVPQAHRQPEQDQGDRARDRLPRHHPRRAVGDRHHQPAHAVRAAHARAAATCPTPTPTGCPRA